MNNEIYEMYKRNFPYINREEKISRGYAYILREYM